MSGIKSKVVAITGASSGIGEATALLLAERGAKVVLGARGPERLAALADRIVRAGGEAAYAPTDVKTARRSVRPRQAGVRAVRQARRARQQRRRDAHLPARRPARRGLGGDDRRQPQGRALRHRRGAARLPQAGIRTLRQHRLHAGLKIVPIHVGLCRHEVRGSHHLRGLAAGGRRHLRVTIISPGLVRTNFAEGMTNQTVKAQLEQSRTSSRCPPDAIARAIAFAIEQPADVDVSEIVVRPTAQK